MNNKVYFTVKMERWGNPELHSYNLGVFHTFDEAYAAGKENEEYRAGKYEPYIEMWTTEEKAIQDTTIFNLGPLELFIRRIRRRKERYIDIFTYSFTRERGVIIGLWYFSISLSLRRKVDTIKYD